MDNNPKSLTQGYAFGLEGDPPDPKNRLSTHVVRTHPDAPGLHGSGHEEVELVDPGPVPIIINRRIIGLKWRPISDVNGRIHQEFADLAFVYDGDEDELDYRLVSVHPRLGGKLPVAKVQVSDLDRNQFANTARYPDKTQYYDHDGDGGCCC
jgi:hypothetical protein